MSLCFFQETNRRQKRERETSWRKKHNRNNAHEYGAAKSLQSSRENVSQITRQTQLTWSYFLQYHFILRIIKPRALTNSGLLHYRFILYMYIHKICCYSLSNNMCACVCVLRVNDVCSSAQLSLIQQQMLAYYPRCVFDKNKALWLCVCVSSVWGVINTVKLYVRVLLRLNRSSR